jgi:adenosylcobinamide-GDP ribazoletransferase
VTQIDSVSPTASGGRRRRVRPLTELRAAAGLLTRVPVGGAPVDTAGAAVFPLVGAMIGAVGMAPLLVIGWTSPLLAALLALATTAVVTGAIHLDAVADTADALMARDRAAAEEARRDPRLGTGGVLGLLFVVTLEAAALTALTVGLGPVAAWAVGIVACSASRAAPVVIAVVAAGRITGEGSGDWFVRQVGVGAAVFAIASGAAIALIAGIAGTGLVPGVALAGAALGIALGLAIVRVRGQLDGDGLGASTELAFATALVLAAWSVG